MPVESQNAAKRANVDTINVQRRLIDWYAAHARALPWRAPPGSEVRPDPYHVWLSEVMLQQTTVAAVRPYFERFVARWPTVAALAAAPEADVLAAWAGLGYYSRARNLIASAGFIAATYAGRFPGDAAALRDLPGIGDYTAAAIAAFAFGSDDIPLDANLERVIARLFVVETPLPRARAELMAKARTLWPAARGGDFAQALMDLGSRICTARNPRCDVCPLATDCNARIAGRADALPVKSKKKRRPERHGRALWLERDQAVWLVRRPPRGLLGGMRALPGGVWGDAAEPVVLGATPLGTVRHIFTHFALTLSIDRADPALAVGEGEWWPVNALDAAGLPTLYQRAALLACANQDAPAATGRETDD